MALICIFMMVSDVGHHFLYLLAICMSSWQKCLLKFLCPFLIELFGAFCYWAVEVLHVFWIVIPHHIEIFQIFSFRPYVAFSFWWLIPLLCIVFRFEIVSLVYFQFCCLCFWCHIQEITAKPSAKKFSSRSFKFQVLPLSV